SLAGAGDGRRRRREVAPGRGRAGAGRLRPRARDPGRARGGPAHLARRGAVLRAGRVPDPGAGGGGLLPAPPGGHRLRPVLGDAVDLRRPDLLVALLDEEPGLGRVARVAALDPDQRPLAPELLAVETELQGALAQPLVRVLQRLPGPAVPEQHGAP